MHKKWKCYSFTKLYMRMRVCVCDAPARRPAWCPPVADHQWPGQSSLAAPSFSLCPLLSALWDWGNMNWKCLCMCVCVLLNERLWPRLQSLVRLAFHFVYCCRGRYSPLLAAVSVGISCCFCCCFEVGNFHLGSEILITVWLLKYVALHTVPKFCILTQMMKWCYFVGEITISYIAR